MTKLREFWIEFEGDPGFDLKGQMRFVSGVNLKPTFPDEEIIHVREVSPKREAAIEKMVEALEFYQDKQTLKVPDDWSYAKMGGLPDTDDLETEDIGYIAKLALDEWRKVNESIKN